MQVDFLNLNRQLQSIESEVKTAINNVVDSCYYILGQHVTAFEKDFADFLEINNSFGISNGLDALRIALECLKLGPDDEVILPANSYIATALAVSGVAGKIRLVDCDITNYNIDPEAIRKAVNPNTKVIIPVHLAGLCSDMDPIMEIAREHNLYVIEDAAQAHGTRYKERRAGTIGDFGCFSFYPGKNLGAYGDGGAIVCRDEAFEEEILMYRNYGQKQKYHHLVKGLNCRLDEIQAAVLSVKLKYLESWNEQRQKNAQIYRQELSGVQGVTVRPEVDYSSHIYHLFIIEVEQRDQLQAYLKEQGITTLIHYPVPIHLQEAYKELGYKKGDFPVAERLAESILSLPMYAELKEEEIRAVCSAIKSFYRQS